VNIIGTGNELLQSIFFTCIPGNLAPSLTHRRQTIETEQKENIMEHSVYLDPAEYASKIQAMDITKEQAALQLVQLKLPLQYIYDVLMAFK
jgi:hypothetical protein